GTIPSKIPFDVTSTHERRLDRNVRFVERGTGASLAPGIERGRLPKDHYWFNGSRAPCVSWYLSDVRRQMLVKYGGPNFCVSSIAFSKNRNVGRASSR